MFWCMFGFKWRDREAMWRAMCCIITTAYDDPDRE